MFGLELVSFATIEDWCAKFMERRNRNHKQRSVCLTSIYEKYMQRQQRASQENPEKSVRIVSHGSRNGILNSYEAVT